MKPQESIVNLDVGFVESHFRFGGLTVTCPTGWRLLALLLARNQVGDRVTGRSPHELNESIVGIEDRPILIEPEDPERGGVRELFEFTQHL